MRTVLKSEDFEELVLIRELPDEFANDEGLKEFSYQTDYKGIRGESNALLLDGLYIEYGNLTLPNDSRVWVEQDSPHLELHIELSGNTFYTNSSVGGKNVDIPNRSGVLFYFPELKGRLDFAKTDERKSIEIEFSINYLNSLFNNDWSFLGVFGKNVEKGLPTILNEKSFSISPIMTQIIFDIIQCSYTGILKKIYVESKTRELLTLFLDQSDFQLIKNIVGKWTKNDIEKLYFAKTLIEQNSIQVLSLTELAKMVGLNDFKLKKGFKELFGTTVFGYLNDIRMIDAKMLLVEGKHSIAEVSYFVGFKNPQHFTVAYKRKFGFLPKDHRRK